jgi:hypothetical protein
MHVFVVGNGAIAFFVAFFVVAAIIKLKKKIAAAESDATEQKASTTILDTETGKTRNVKPGDFI